VREGLQNTIGKGTIAVRVRARVFKMGLRREDYGEGQSEGLEVR